MVQFLPAAGRRRFLPWPRRAAVPTGRRGWRLALGRKGASTSDFAIVAVPAILMVYCIMEASWQVATAAALDNAALKASRFGMVGLNTPAGVTGAPICRSAAIPWMAAASSGGFLRADRMTVTSRSFASYGTVSPDGNAGTLGPGSGGQVVRYILTYRQPYLISGVASLVTGATEMTYQAVVTVKNELFENTVC